MAATKHCGKWITSKRRHCAGSCSPGSEFCGNHQPSSEAKRVPCPIDPSHSVIEDKVKTHISKCPATKLQQASSKWPYYAHSVNAGSDDESEKVVNKRILIQAMPKDAFEEFVGRIENAYCKSCSDIYVEDSFIEPRGCSKWLSSDVDRRHPLQKKHIAQQASMLGNLEAFGLLHEVSSPHVKHVCVEFGAGRGYLSHMISDCYAVDRVVLVERRSYKFKADRTLRYSSRVSLSRLRIDIEDLKLDGVDELQGCHFVAVSKHLCGSATDLALRCCISAMKNEREIVVDGIGIATCCHHLCEWKSYVNKEFFESMGFNAADFNAIAWLTSWSLSDKQSNEEEEEEDKAKKMKKELGMKCKRLLDVGRMRWLEGNKMKTRMVKYVSRNISPENTLLLASCTSA